MRGANLKRAPVFHDGSVLGVKRIFSTIQGEGPMQGWPAVFVRLGGCNLACEFCDTFFEDFLQLKIDEIIDKIYSLLTHLPNTLGYLIVISGGEPLRQPIQLLCDTLVNLGFIVQIETNGTIYRQLPREVTIVCSPKYNTSYIAPDQRFVQHKANFFLKFLVSERVEGYNSIPDFGFNFPREQVLLQPMDEFDEQLNQNNARLAVRLAIKYNFKLCLQIHKILNIE
ncbi:7-carboxy-7-deazaguanine synthase [Rickettsiales endosymbiont of Paramecium tredecaurelia]|uniref:7-carboxy-7-deazaguanine synthase QueE n=1 Tax=Candidatus Sarmatiella mevalonica TaxID=2770581 RepID=UPI0019238B45|nr:7-carboxy-7-deazaguanine synthase QueE [Candidatus Sarmatiella mevalonica]MBL3285156.1 7-carboxy-7-deazaguanine synthase [Candidatus Sarmatiella mevalonica]